MAFGDIHFHHTHRFSHITESGYTTRELEHLSCADTLIRLYKEKNIDMLVFLGDAWQAVGDSMSAETQKAMLDFFAKFNEEHITVYCITGNHDRCLDINTEVLTENGWKYYSEIDNNLKLAQIDINTHELSYALPLKRIYNQSDIVYEMAGKYYYDFCITPDHDIIYKNKKIKLLDALKTYNDLNCCDLLKYIKCYNNKDYLIDDNIIRLLIWTIADGTIVYENCTKVDGTKYQRFKRIQWHLKRKDKINNLKKLLNEMHIHYTITKDYNKEDCIYIKIFTHNADCILPYLNKTKDFPDFFRYLSKRQFQIVLTTLLQTDGYQYDNYIGVSFINESNIDILQELAFRCGYFCKKKIKVNKYGYKKNSILYSLKILDVTKFKEVNKKVKFIKEKISDTFCFTMPKGTLITRYKGNITIVGNCTANNDIHKLEALKYMPHIRLATKPKEVTYLIGGEEVKFVCMPYCIHDDEAIRFLENVKNKQEKIVISHLELGGINLGNGIVTTKGVPLDLLKEFKMTLQGHYHNPMKIAPNIQIAGSTQRLSFKDKGIARNNILIYDTQTNKVERCSFECPDWLTFTDDNIDDLLKIDDNNYVRVELSTDILMTENIKNKLERVKGKDIHIDLHRISVNKQVNSEITAEDNIGIIREFVNKSDNSDEQKEALINEGIRLLNKTC